jgi:AmmeMemoRadiSam system protein B/AmmeMemoRadiSam system protein A
MRTVLLIILVGLPFWSLQAQKTPQAKPRPPAVAGSFYASDPGDLKRDLEFLFSRVQPSNKGGSLLAVIAPHAGYPFSGEVAANAYAQINPEKTYQNIFVIGNSHRYAFEGAAVYSSGNYQTPLGEVPVNLELAGELIEKYRFFQKHDLAHLNEHSLEVQLPFLQYHLKKEFRIVPILLGTHSESVCREIAAALKPYLNEQNLFVISADFSHYPDYRNANIVDLNTANAICTNDPVNFLTALKQNEEKNIPNLATSACAWPSILTLLHMTRDDREHIEYELVRYQNSGDTRIGDKSRVVGYCAITIRRQDYTLNGALNNRFMLSDEDKRILMEIARSTLDSYIRSGSIPRVDNQAYSPTLQTHTGAFVTLHKNGQLRGCIGRFRPDKPLYEVVRDMTISASTKDFRFKPVKTEELDEIELEISVLTPLERISDPSEIKLGQHGIYIRRGSNSGTFLPQVATQTGWNLEEFLGHCARDKAQIGWYGWKDAELYIYEALVFHE